MNKLLVAVALCLCVSGALAGPSGDAVGAHVRDDYAIPLWLMEL